MGSTRLRPASSLYVFIMVMIGLLAFQAAASPFTVEAASSTAQRRVSVYLFWGEGCGFCEKEIRFLKDLQGKYPGLEVEMFEVWHNQSNLVLFEDMCRAYGLNRIPGVPTLFIGEDVVIGYGSDETTGKRIEELVKLCLSEGCLGPAEKLSTSTAVTSIKLTETVESVRSSALSGEESCRREGTCEATSVVETSIRSRGQPPSGGVKPIGGLFLFTVSMGLVDGFNPCSIWVLCLLLSLLLHVSRRRMTLVGGVFIAFSALVYLMFLEAWFTLNQVLKYIVAFRAVLGLAVVGVGVMGVKDFITSFKGVSLTIPKSVKPRIYEGMRRLLSQGSSTPILLSGVASLAFMVNAFELLCTAGLPAAYTQVLSSQTLPRMVYHAYLWVYALFYMFDELALLAVFAFTSKALKLSLWYGRLAKLVGGAVMVALGLALLIKPEALTF